MIYALIANAAAILMCIAAVIGDAAPRRRASLHDWLSRPVQS